MLQENMLRVFVDSDVAFDIISIRVPFYKDSSEILELVHNGSIVIATSESCISNIIYLSFDIKKLKNATQKISNFVNICSIITSGKKGILQALESNFRDKEDAIQYHTALYNEMDYFVTRNIKDYKAAVKSLPVITPKELSAILSGA